MKFDDLENFAPSPDIFTLTGSVGRPAPTCIADMTLHVCVYLHVHVYSILSIACEHSLPVTAWSVTAL